MSGTGRWIARDNARTELPLVEVEAYSEGEAIAAAIDKSADPDGLGFDARTWVAVELTEAQVRALDP